MEINEIIRSKRRSFAIQVKRDGRLIVRAPQKASLKEIKRIVEQKSEWILRKQNLVQQKLTEITPKRYLEGEEFLFLGKKHPLYFKKNPGYSIALSNGSFTIDENYIGHERDLFVFWYKIQAKRIFTERAAFYSSQTGLRFSKIKVTNALKRWGSCSSKGNLNFPWRLVMGPAEVIDYVVVHEIAHIRHKNHSKFYWKKVESILPEYKKHEKWLKDNGHLLML